jgi:hypothetical protein
MGWMRVSVLVALASVLLVAAGCGGSNEAGPNISSAQAEQIAGGDQGSIRAEEALFAEDVTASVEQDFAVDDPIEITSMDCQLNADRETGICIAEAQAPDGGEAEMGIEIKLGRDATSLVWEVTDCRDTGSVAFC